MAGGALEALVTVQRGPATRMGAERILLLQAIKSCGSIAGAARAVGLSYKAAWDAVNAMNNLFGAALVDAKTGGRKGGGAGLTPAGEKVLEAFAGIEQELGRFLDRLQHQLAQAAPPFSPTFLWSLMMKTSARNVYHCTVDQVIDGAVNSEILLHLTDGQTLTAIITKRSADDLGLEPGKPCYALIKSSFVILTPDDDRLKTSARNRLRGRVISHDTGAVNSEIILDLGGGKTLAAIITKESADSLEFKVGDRACALIKASHIILMVE